MSDRFQIIDLLVECEKSLTKLQNIPDKLIKDFAELKIRSLRLEAEKLKEPMVMVPVEAPNKSNNTITIILIIMLVVLVTWFGIWLIDLL